MTCIADKFNFFTFYARGAFRCLALSVLALFGRPVIFTFKSESKSARNFAGVCGSMGFLKIPFFKNWSWTTFAFGKNGQDLQK